MIYYFVPLYFIGIALWYTVLFLYVNFQTLCHSCQYFQKRLADFDTAIGNSCLISAKFTYKPFTLQVFIYQNNFYTTKIFLSHNRYSIQIAKILFF